MEEGPSHRRGHKGSVYSGLVLVSLIYPPKELLNLKAVQEVDVKEKVFLSRVFTVPKLERGKEYGRRFILNLKVSSLHTALK